MPNTTQSAAYEFPRCPPTVFLPALPSAPVAWSVGKSISQPAVSKRSLTFAKINKISLSATFKLPNASIYRKNNYTLSANTPTPFHFHTSANHATISNKKSPSHHQVNCTPKVRHKTFGVQFTDVPPGLCFIGIC